MHAHGTCFAYAIATWCFLTGGFAAQYVGAVQGFVCLVAGNIIATPAIRFLDWEYACDNDQFFDLATVVAHHDLSDDRADFLLNAYFDGNFKSVSIGDYSTLK